MIRINLLGNAGQAGNSLIPAANRPALAGMLFLLCTLAGVGGWWWTMGRQAAALDAQIVQSEGDLARLKEAAKLVDRAIARKSELAEKLALIERLRTAQRGPVTLLSTINRSLPDGLWLLELNQRGAGVQLEGRATTLTAVTDFVERLQASGAFDRPVEIVTTSMETMDELSVVRFAVKAQAAGTAAAAAAAAAAGEAKKGD
jgi:Tfp pilus assembly protein PilN